jgi:hypothetical protein
MYFFRLQSFTLVFMVVMMLWIGEVSRVVTVGIDEQESFAQTTGEPMRNRIGTLIRYGKRADANNVSVLSKNVSY